MLGIDEGGRIVNRKWIVFVLILAMTFFTVACSGTSEETSGAGAVEEVSAGNAVEEAIDDYFSVDHSYYDFNGNDILIESIIEYEDYYNLAVHYPIAENSEINQEIADILRPLVEEVRSDSETFFTTFDDSDHPIQWKYELNVDFKLYQPNEDYASIAFEVLNFSGASVNVQYITRTFDLETGAVVELSDVFIEGADYLNRISEYARGYFTEDIIGQAYHEEMLISGTEPVAENFSSFVLNKEGIIFFFPKYSIAPGAAGSFQMTLPYEEVMDILNVEQNQIEGGTDSDQGAVVGNEEARVVPTENIIALTFDDGPHPTNTAKILDELKARDAVATFFVLGNRVDYYPDVLKRIVTEGSEIGNHTWNHREMTKMSTEEIAWQVGDTQKAIKAITGYEARVLRPPYGSMNEATASRIDHPLILWSVDTLDWRDRDVDIIQGNVYSVTKDGDIVLMHDIHATTADSVGGILDYYIEKGYTFVTVSELLQFGETNPPIAGKKYYKK